jgi:hypothetical protein
MSCVTNMNSLCTLNSLSMFAQDVLYLVAELDAREVPIVTASNLHVSKVMFSLTPSLCTQPKLGNRMHRGHLQD